MLAEILDRAPGRRQRPRFWRRVVAALTDLDGSCRETPGSFNLDLDLDLNLDVDVDLANAYGPI